MNVYEIINCNEFLMIILLTACNFICFNDDKLIKIVHVFLFIKEYESFNNLINIPHKSPNWC